MQTFGWEPNNGGFNLCRVRRSGRYSANRFGAGALQGLRTACPDVAHQFGKIDLSGTGGGSWPTGERCGCPHGEQQGWLDVWALLKDSTGGEEAGIRGGSEASRVLTDQRIKYNRLPSVAIPD